MYNLVQLLLRMGEAQNLDLTYKHCNYTTKKQKLQQKCNSVCKQETLLQRIWEMLVWFHKMGIYINSILEQYVQNTR